MKQLFALLALALLVGCSGTSNAGRSTAAPQALLSDAFIYAQIEAKFASIDSDSALHVALSVNDGVVKMSGKTRSASTIARFISAAKSVSGVKTVDARLQADARLQSAGQLAKDFALASAVKGNIAAQAGINALAVDVVANRGTVVVSGTVHSAPLKSTVVAAAKSTNGVQRLIDEIRVAQ